MRHFGDQLIWVSRDTVLFCCCFKLVDVRAKTLQIIDRHNLFNTLALTLLPQMIYPTSHYFLLTYFRGVALDSATTETFTCYREMNSHLPASRPLTAASWGSSSRPSALWLEPGPPKYSHLTSALSPSQVGLCFFAWLGSKAHRAGHLLRRHAGQRLNQIGKHTRALGLGQFIQEDEGAFNKVCLYRLPLGLDSHLWWQECFFFLV